MFFYFILCLLSTSFVFSDQTMDIVQKANQASYYQGSSGKARVKMKIVDQQGQERSRSFVVLRRNGDTEKDQKFYVFFTRPADVNKMAFVVWKQTQRDDERWLYLPSLDLLKRIAASDERTSFVGSHFFYEDVSGREPEKDLHEKIEETEHFYVIKSRPKDPQEVEFAFYKSWIHKTTYLPIKVEYYDELEQAYRRYEALRVEVFDDFPTVSEAKMSDLNTESHTILEYDKVQYHIEIPEEIFSERYLRSPPKRLLR